MSLLFPYLIPSFPIIHKNNPTIKCARHIQTTGLPSIRLALHFFGQEKID